MQLRALAHGSLGVVGPESRSWASRAADAWIKASAARQIEQDRALWLASLEMEAS